MDHETVTSNRTGRPSAPSLVGAGVPIVAASGAVLGQAGVAFLVGLVFSFTVAQAAAPAPPRPTRPRSRAQLRSRAGLVVVAKMVALATVVGMVAALTGAWWVGLAGAPLGARICGRFARRAPFVMAPSSTVGVPRD